MTTSAQRLGTPLPVGSTVPPGSLRAKMEEARSRGTLHTLKETVGIIVPLAVEIAERHAAGEPPRLCQKPRQPDGRGL